MSQASRPVAGTLSFPTFFLDCYDAIHVQARRPTKAIDLQIDHGSDFTALKVQWDSNLSLSGLDKSI